MKPSITIIGAGSVGTSLALALHANAYPIRAIVSRTHDSARSLAQRVCCITSYAIGEFRLPADGVVFIAVPDDALSAMASLLAGGADGKLSPAVNSPGTAVVVHTSGALPSEILSPLRQCGVAIGSFHPLMLFPLGRSTGKELISCPVAIEGDERAVEAVTEIARRVNAKPFAIQPNKKTFYHIAAVFASNYLVTLLDAVEKTGAVMDIPRGEVATLFEPIIRQTLDAVLRTSPRAALTGPIVRNDRDTIRKHLDALRTLGDVRILSLYIELGLATAQLAKETK